MFPVETIESDAPSPSRAGRRMRRLSGPDVAATLVFFLAGLLFAASALTSGGQDIRTQRTGQLRDEVLGRAAEVRRLQVEINQLSTEIEDLRTQSDVANRETAAKKTIDETSPQAGLTEAIGPSVTVELKDSPLTPEQATEQGVQPEELVIHQQDVQAVVNAMWRGGASAIEVMDQRLVSTSAVRCVGNTLLLQGRVYSPPFRIIAIGDQKGMLASMASDPDVEALRFASQRLKLGFSVSQQRETTIPPFDGSITPKLASVAT